MNSKPLLTFNPPKLLEKVKTAGVSFQPYSNLKRPGHSGQKVRLEPQFKILQKVIEQRNAELTKSTTAISPENAIVFELIGSIEDFNSAVRKGGMEWLGEIEDEIEPDSEFFLEKNNQRTEKPIDRRVLLVMANQEAINQLLSFWDSYIKNEKVKLGHGLNKFKTIFAQLKEVRRWGVKDRLDEFGLLEDFRERLNQPIDGDQVPFEIDLWYRDNSSTRMQAQNTVIGLLKDAGGDVTAYVDLPDIHYHGIVGRLPATQIRQMVQQWAEVLEGKTIELFSCDDVMLFRPLTQAISDPNFDDSSEPPDEESEEPASTTNLFSDLPPIVSLIDGLPLANHQRLSGHLVIDDPRDFSSKVQAKDRKHGTQMASLIVHGDLSTNEQPLLRPLLAHPVLTTLDGVNGETFPRDIHYLDLIHLTFKRIFEDTSNTKIHVINFSIGAANRPFYNQMSPLARLLDWLSFKYKVLIIVSAGNYSEEIALDISYPELKKLEPEKQQLMVLKAIQDDMRIRRILSPAEAVNPLTIGALHVDDSTLQPHSQVFNPLPIGRATVSPISPLGYGYRGAVKPEIVAPGGRQPYSVSVHNGKIKLKINSVYSAALGQLVATPGQPGNLTTEKHTRGTSNAAALTTRRAAQLYEVLETLRQNEEDWKLLTDEYISVVLKAMLVHGSSWGDNEWLLKLWDLVQSKKNSKGSASQVGMKEFITRYVGFGALDFARIIECVDNRATLVGWGVIEKEMIHEFSMPLPNSLQNLKAEKRLTTTLAWFSPVNGRHR